MVLVAAREDVDALLASLKRGGERGAVVIGEIAKGSRSAVVRFAR
jgi:hypothetical protein